MSAVDFAIPVLLFSITAWLVLTVLEVQNSARNKEYLNEVLIDLWFPTALLGLITIASLIFAIIPFINL